MRYRMHHIAKEQEEQFVKGPRVSVLIGERIVQLNLIESGVVDLQSRDVTVSGPKVSARDDIDTAAFRQAVLDLYAIFPSTR